MMEVGEVVGEVEEGIGGIEVVEEVDQLVHLEVRHRKGRYRWNRGKWRIQCGILHLSSLTVLVLWLPR